VVNPLAAAIARESLRVLVEEKLVETVRGLEIFQTKLLTIKISDKTIRGKGLFIA